MAGLRWTVSPLSNLQRRLQTNAPRQDFLRIWTLWLLVFLMAQPLECLRASSLWGGYTNRQCPSAHSWKESYCATWCRGEQKQSILPQNSHLIDRIPRLNNFINNTTKIIRWMREGKRVCFGSKLYLHFGNVTVVNVPFIDGCRRWTCRYSTHSHSQRRSYPRQREITWSLQQHSWYFPRLPFPYLWGIKSKRWTLFMKMF